MKKIRTIIAVMGIALILTGCGNKVVENPIEEDKVATEDQNKKYSETVESQKEPIEGGEKVEEEKIQEEEVSKKEEYIQKLDSIENGLSDLNALSATGVTSDMIEAAGKKNARWDDALNEIYNYLKTKLSTSEMDILTEKQVEWIEYRDLTAKNESLMFEGGTMERIQYPETLARLTKERCYELVRTYIK